MSSSDTDGRVYRSSVTPDTVSVDSVDEFGAAVNQVFGQTAQALPVRRPPMALPFEDLSNA